jgi:hypothetical protein
VTEICVVCGDFGDGPQVPRDGEDRHANPIGPWVRLCVSCHGLMTLEQVWRKVGTYVRFPHEAGRRVAEQTVVGMTAAVCPDSDGVTKAESAPGDELYDPAREVGPVWFVALCSAWAGGSLWTRAHPRVKIADLVRRCMADGELQAAVSGAARAGAGGFALLSMINDWEGAAT